AGPTSTGPSGYRRTTGPTPGAGCRRCATARSPAAGWRRRSVSARPHAQGASGCGLRACLGVGGPQGQGRRLQRLDGVIADVGQRVGHLPGAEGGHEVANRVLDRVPRGPAELAADLLGTDVVRTQVVRRRGHDLHVLPDLLADELGDVEEPMVLVARVEDL